MRRLRFSVAVCALFSSFLGARASTITDNITFHTGIGSGSFTLTFDPTMNYAFGSTTGLVVNSLNLGFSSPVESTFSYVAGPDGYFTFGGLLNGSSIIRNTDDYYLEIVPGKPSADILTVATGTSDVLRKSLALVTITQDVGVTPEPSSFMLLGTGLLGLAGVIKRRFA